VISTLPLHYERDTEQFAARLNATATDEEADKIVIRHRAGAASRRLILR